MNKYITVIDPQGATLGYGGPSVSISHRMLCENKQFYGFESVAKLFGSHQAFLDFLQHASKATIGTSGTHATGSRELSWSVDAV